MRHHLTGPEREELDKLIAEAERSSSAEIVLACVQRSDSYAEIPWIAFSLGTAIAALAVVIADLAINPWPSGSIVLLALVTALLSGILLAILTLLWPRFARLFLSRHRREMEVWQYAQAMFLERELFATSRRRGLLLMVSLFERQVVIIADKGLRSTLDDEARKSIISDMVPLLRGGRLAAAMKSGLALLVDRIGNWPVEKTDDEIPNDIIEEEGI